MSDSFASLRAVFLLAFDDLDFQNELLRGKECVRPALNSRMLKLVDDDIDFLESFVDAQTLKGSPKELFEALAGILGPIGIIKPAPPPLWPNPPIIPEE